MALVAEADVWDHQEDVGPVVGPRLHWPRDKAAVEVLVDDQEH